MIGYCIPCANRVGAQPAHDACTVQGTCSICAKEVPVLGTSSFLTNRHLLNPAALRAKQQRGAPLPRTEP